MDKRTIDILDAGYRPRATLWDPVRGQSILDEAVVTTAERAHLDSAGIVVNDFVTWEHDELVDRARAAARTLDLRGACAAFVAGVGGSARRGLPVLDGYTWCAKLPDHSYQTVPELRACGVCGATQSNTVDRTVLRLRFWQGQPWSNLIGAVVNLEEWRTLPPATPTAQDRLVFEALLDALAAAAPTLSPSGAVKLLGQAKVIPKSNAGLRYRILEALADTGVLPQTSIGLRTEQWVDAVDQSRAWSTLGRSHRSDVPLPLAAWNGAHGVDRRRAIELFAHC
ncbi:hypothetical protein AB0H76_34810 [Nocardia sp. NPDC050712]|uniref:hypothetical protein n=1 Tax=Nocardia sp. NPDC050712 TaxID=3155518 RepID=UPI0033FA15D1